jgi:hypothetical protein
MPELKIEPAAVKLSPTCYYMRLQKLLLIHPTTVPIGTLTAARTIMVRTITLSGTTNYANRISWSVLKSSRTSKLGD